MKTFKITLLVACFVLYSCGMKCDGYAPKGTKISWNEYNTVKQVKEYFQYKNSADLHRDDSVRMCGYVVGSCCDTNYFLSVYEQAEQHNHAMVYLCDDPTARHGTDAGGRISMALVGNFEQMKWLKDYKEGEKVYVTGYCYAGDPEDDRGCFWIPTFQVERVIIK